MKKGNTIVALLVVISCLFQVSPLLAQTTIIFQPGPDDGKDVRVHSMYPDQNNATDKAFRASAWTIQGTPMVERTFVDFDLSIIPEGAEIISAFLSLYSYYDDPYGQLHSSLSGTNQAWLRKVTADWNEDDVTWRKQPEYETNGQVYLPQSNSPTQHYENIDVTDIISDIFYFPDEYFGLAFMLNNENYYRRMSFCTSDHHDPDRRPKLEITYIGSLPLADFSFEIDDLQADFISQVLNGDSFLWDFGDGAISTDKNPVHIYSDYGDYDVTLVASNVFGADSVTKTVSLCELPVAAFEIEIDIRTIFLTNISSVADTYYWDFGDGYSSTLKDPVHEYISEGEYFVTLISYNECGSDTTTTLISIPDKQWDDQAFILIYPNPTRGKVDIKIFIEDFIETDMVLFNEIGQSIKKIKLTEASTNLDLSHLQAGVYVVKLTAGNIYHRSVLIIF